jgi:hypothetical protein
MVAAGCTLATDIGLKFAGELTDVVQMTGEACFLGATKRSGKRRCSRSHSRKMMGQRLPSIDRLPF